MSMSSIHFLSIHTFFSNPGSGAIDERAVLSAATRRGGAAEARRDWCPVTSVRCGKQRPQHGVVGDDLSVASCGPRARDGSLALPLLSAHSLVVAMVDPTRDRSSAVPELLERRRSCC